VVEVRGKAGKTTGRSGRSATRPAAEPERRVPNSEGDDSLEAIRICCTTTDCQRNGTCEPSRDVGVLGLI